MSNSASDSTLSKLLEVDSDLATQAATLTAQLETLQEKRRSLQSVIEIFGAPDTVTTRKSETNGVPQTSSSKSLPKLSVAASSVEDEAQTSEEPKPSRRGRKPTKAPLPRKTSRKAKGWQHYVRREFSKISLPEAVSNVLQSRPRDVVGVPEIVDTLFVDETPKDVRNDARNRVSNVLSIGLKDNKWYRGKKGKYSLSREAAQASMA